MSAPSMKWKYHFSYDGNRLNMCQISNILFSQIDMNKMIEIIIIVTVLLHTTSLHMSCMIFFSAFDFLLCEH